ncbi:MAG TPA: zeta toxin family protein [Thermoanaerobaculia bacterium]|nr:zeta toxin family protein [Thermoanaerobaculia bacterium]
MPAGSRIYVLAGVNGAGKSSIGGAAFRASGADYYNPDEAARELITKRPGRTLAEANADAWRIGRAMLERAIRERLDFAFETTLGGNTIQRLLAEAAKGGIEIHMWYVGLKSPELHVERVAARVRRGGHSIPEEKIRERYIRSRLNLIQLLPVLAALRVYDNSDQAEPEAGIPPVPKLVLDWETGRILGPKDLSQTPNWAKPIVAAALQRASVGHA